jgi:TP901 family phage tail tape measure protein
MAGNLPKVGVEMVAENSATFLRAMDDGSRAVTGFGGNLTSTAPRFSSFEQIAVGSLRRVGELAVNSMLEAGRALAGFGADSVSLASDFEATINSFSSVAGPLDEAGLSVEDFERKFLELGASTKYSAQQAAEAGVELVKGGVSIEEVMGGATDATLALAAAGDLELAPAATIVAKQLGVWGDTGVTAADAANLLAQAANASTVDVEELALGLANVGGTAKVTGVSFEETVQAVALLAPGFSSAADASTSLKTFLSRLIPTTKDATGMMLDLGLYTEETGSRFFDAQGEFIGMQAAAGLLQQATADLSSEQKLLAFQTIFGADAIRAASMIAEEGAAGFANMGVAMDSTGSVFDQAAKKNEGFKAAVEGLTGSFESLQIVVGKRFLPTLTPLVKLATNATNILYEMAMGSDNVAGAVDTFGASLAEMSPTLGKWFDVITSGRGVLDGFLYIVGDITSRFGPLGTAAQNLINIFLRGQDSFANWTFLGRSLKSVFGPELGATFTNFFWIVQQGFDFIGDLAAEFSIWRAMGSGIGESLLKVGDLIAETFGPSIMAALPVVGQAVLDFVTQAASFVANAIPQVRQAFLNWALVAADWALDAVPGMLSGLEILLKGAADWAVDAAVQFGEQMLAFGQQAVAWIAPRLPELGNQLGAFFNRMVTWVVDSLPGWAEKLGMLGEKAVAWVSDALPGLATNLGLFAGNLLAWIVRTIGDVTPKLVELAGKFISWIWTDVLPELPGAAMKIWDALNTFIGTAATLAVTELAKLGAKFNEWVEKDVLPVLPDKLAAIWDTISGWVSGIIGTVKTKLQEIGSAIIDGMIEGVTAAAGRLYDATIGAVWNAITGAQTEIDSHSPSRVTRDLIGIPFMEGIVTGVQDVAPTLADALVGGIDTAMMAGDLAAELGGDAINATLGSQLATASATVSQLQAAMAEAQALSSQVGGMYSGAGGSMIRPPMGAGGGLAGNISNVSNGPTISYSPTYNSPAPPPAMSYAALRTIAGG